MKDYTFDLESKKEFILNYELNDNDIIINFANGTKYIVPLTDGNEEIILKKMKDQIIESEGNEKKLREKITSKRILAIISIIIGAFLSLGIKSILNDFDFMYKIIIYNIPIVIGTINCGKCMILSEKCKNKLKDLEKNKFFLENERTIQEALTNNNVLINSHNNIKKLANEQDLNINTIDSYSFQDLKRIIDYTEIENNFEFEQFKEEKHVKKRTRKR